MTIQTKLLVEKKKQLNNVKFVRTYLKMDRRSRECSNYSRVVFLVKMSVPQKKSEFEFTQGSYISIWFEKSTNKQMDRYIERGKLPVVAELLNL